MGARNFLRKEKFSKYMPMAKRIMTLDQMIQFCITHPLEGKALSWDDQRITDLASYINSLYEQAK